MKKSFTRSIKLIKGVDIPNEEKEKSDCPAILYGTDYYGLQDSILNILTKHLHLR